MRFLVWLALTFAGFGYWWFCLRKQKLATARWTEQDNTDTAEAVAKMYRRNENG